MNKALIVPDKKKILLRDTHPTRITTVIPSSKIIQYKGVDLVVVPHELDEVRVLNNMGYNITSPVSHYYKWSGRYTPFTAQGVTVDKMTLNERMFVLNGMGTGKSLSTLWAYDFLRSEGLVRRMLIVSPLSTMECVWANEVFEHFPHLETQVLYGTAKRRVDQLSYMADIYIINHDGVKVPEIREALLKRDDIDVVTVDELAEFRNAGTDRWKALKRITEKRKYLWGLTGTPIPNRPTDSWAQCRLIAPHRVPPYFGRFREMVERKVSVFKWVARDNALQTVMEAMQPSVLFQLKDIPEAELPPTTYSERFVEMSAEQKKAYKQMMTSLVAEASAGQIMAVNEAVKAAKLAQIACLGEWTWVLTNNDWKVIKNVLPTDLLWDGKSWVKHGGVVSKGVKKVIRSYDVDATPDHRVLVQGVWIEWEKMCFDDWSYACIEEDKRPSLMFRRLGLHKRDMLRMPKKRYGGDDTSTPDPEYCCQTTAKNSRVAYPFEAKLSLPPLPENHAVETYDILDAGPRNRFVIWTSKGPLCVHNCGVAYDQNGECVQFDCQNRLEVLKEIVAESDGKVIVFVPLTGGLEMVAEFLGQTWPTAVVHGDVGKTERDAIFNDFGRVGGTHVLVAHPRCMAHGLSLVEANTTVWFIPSNNHGDYVQANGRTVRPGQKRNTFIVHIEGSEVERRMYKRLQTKSSMQNLLLDMIKEGMD